jgi:hypothetical protein
LCSCCGAVFFAQRKRITRKLSHVREPRDAGVSDFPTGCRVPDRCSRLRPTSGATRVESTTNKVGVSGFFRIEFFKRGVDPFLVARTNSRVVFNLSTRDARRGFDSLSRVQIYPPTFFAFFAAQSQIRRL